MHEILGNGLLKLAKEKLWLGELAIIAVALYVKQQNKQTNNQDLSHQVYTVFL